MVMIKEFECINGTDIDIILMESIEGVNRPLARMRPRENYMVRSIVASTTVCEYIIIAKHFVPCMPLPDSSDDWNWKTWDDHVLYVAAPECSHLSVLKADDSIGFRVGHKRVVPSEHIICTLLRRSCLLCSNHSEMGIRDELDSGFIEGFHRREIKSLREIKPNLGHTDGSAALELWESKEKVFRVELENSEAKLKDYGNIILQLVIGFYTVSHGVLFTVVAQPDSPLQRIVGIAYFISAIISFVTIVGVIKNVKAMEILKKLIYEHKARLLAVCRWQSTLKRKGNSFKYRYATLDYKPMPNRVWWPLPWLPLRAAIYTISISVCTFMLCCLMSALQGYIH